MNRTFFILTLLAKIFQQTEKFCNIVGGINKDDSFYK
jgi:hypothetical protein